MSRITGPKCRLCRREGLKLFLKGERCLTDKCAMSRKAYAPGHKGMSSGKPSEYNRQLREKQKTKRIYGLNEKQMTSYYKLANKQGGITGDNLMTLLEMRLDNVVRLGGYVISPSRARQLVNHGLFIVNGKKVNIPSYQCKIGDIIELKASAKKTLKLDDIPKDYTPPSWMNFDHKTKKIEIIATPTPDDIVGLNINTQLIVEFYSR